MVTLDSQRIHKYMRIKIKLQKCPKRQLVKNEINDFIEADSIVNIDNESMQALSNRLNPTHVPVIGPNSQLMYSDVFKNASSTNHLQNSNQLTLHEIIIIGNCHNQVMTKTGILLINKSAKNSNLEF